MKSYTLKEIAQWQKEVSNLNTKISLPSLQRGFVWKPNQIEALWDSIFRGYPIGAILISEDEDENRFLLDGQQRCTSIALGHFNPYYNNNGEFLSLKDYKPSIWIDLAPKTKTEGQKFVFRCLTKSHPWGYQLKDNSVTLSMSNRRNALTFFKPLTESYLDLTSKDINPWDAYFPIPLVYILEIETLNFEIFKNELIQKTRTLKKIETQHSNKGFVDYTLLETDEYEENIKNIFIGYCNYKNLSIPEITVNAKVLKEDDSETDDSQDPSLFVRLNSAGTRISGEELIYSVYKAKFPKIKDLVENIGSSYIAPSKIISLFSRLIICEQSSYINYQKDISIQNFRKKIIESDFKEKLQAYIGVENQSKAKKIIENALSILTKNEPDFPPILLKLLIVTNFDLFFVLLTYINKRGFETLSEVEKNEISSNYVYILWFNKDAKKIASSLFDLLLSESENRTWANSIKILIKENLLVPIVEPILLRKQLDEIVIKNQIQFYRFDIIEDKNLFFPEIKEQLLYDLLNKDIFIENWRLLIEKIFRNKSMLLFAQKEYMNSKFKEFNQFENIEDTNRPWDWDHIYPDSWVYRKEGINQLVRSWVNCIGNFRALSYDDNRSENNHLSPMERFENDSKKEESFVKENDLQFWNQINSTFGRLKENEPEKTKIFLSAVIHRMVNIYEEWFENYYQK